MALLFGIPNPRQRRIQYRQQMRDAEDPFLISDTKFIKDFRLSKECVRYIIARVRPHMTIKKRPNSLSLTRRVLIAIHFCAVGSYQTGIGENPYILVSRSMVSKCLKEFTDVIVNHVANEWIIFPITPLQIARNKRRFLEKFNIPHTIGAVDGTQIAITPPNEIDELYQEHLYINRKQYHSINCQIVTDADLKILSINAKFPGRSHDAYVWKNSTIRSHLLETNAKNTFLIGDSGYPLEPWCITPILGNHQIYSPEHRFNKTHKWARCTVERCIGVLKQRWRCLLKDRTLHYKPTRASKIIITCAVLHNVAIHYNIGLPEYDNEEEEDEYEENHGQEVEELLNAGRQTRQELLNQFFTH
ncbi:unnamed protein product [Macrosiphum euphorbiae]|uniref:DDE Tnp4 domain-containing protein n=1 Tax=Macrosiphum euphorbiae TaxID=13131 RepID=A0AAV0Y9B5_9HEMI|nr:unnamed protein product [Macrosiphum euphorbiae]